VTVNLEIKNSCTENDINKRSEVFMAAEVNTEKKNSMV
jgi:hypothetical protein